MKLEPFALERMQSTYENYVDYNLSESGVHPLRVEQLLDSGAADELLRSELRYVQTNGSERLRDTIASLYHGANTDSVLVTTGGAEANCLSLLYLVEPGDEIVMMVPNYMQAWGVARAFGGVVRKWPLTCSRAMSRWCVDLNVLEGMLSSRTKLILLCNPNNPTGARFESAELDGIAALADRYGSWIISDEIYRGAEHDGHETPSMWGRGSRVLVTSGLAKAYGLPGLRIGWVVGPASVITQLWSYKDYTTIAPSALSDRLAINALSPDRRRDILERTRLVVTNNYPMVRDFCAAHGPLFRHVPPEAGAIVYLTYSYPLNSTELVTRLRQQRGVLVVPGDHFGMDHHLRIGFGEPADYVRTGLGRMAEFFAKSVAM